MKLRMILNALLLFAVALVWAAPLDTSQLAPSVYYGPDGTIAVTEGKLYTVDSSGNPTAITPTAAQINLLLQGTAAGKKINGGTSNVTTSATVASGLSAVTAVVASMGVAPSANTSMVHAEVSGTNIVLYTYKATGETTTTPAPSTTATAIHWIAFGT
jgi:hypothetical protein